MRAPLDSDQPSMSRFFHSLVVFGAGISLSGCGGKTTDDRQHTDQAAGGSSGFGSGGFASTGGSTQLGFGGTGGGAGGDSTGIIIGTFQPADPPKDAGPIPDGATLAQWDCSDQAYGCEYLGGMGGALVGLHEACPVDESRPRTASDCSSAQWFECDAAILNGRQVAVTCRCTPRGDGGVGCNDGCISLNTGQYQPSLLCVNHSKLCGCAVTGIR